MDLARRGLSRAAGIATIHAHAALKIDAAEHAYNRIVADCTKICRLPVTPTVQPARQLAREPEPQARRSLAA